MQLFWRRVKGPVDGFERVQSFDIPARLRIVIAIRPLDAHPIGMRGACVCRSEILAPVDPVTAGIKYPTGTPFGPVARYFAVQSARFAWPIAFQRPGGMDIA
jgi:hypothetical protein